MFFLETIRNVSTCLDKGCPKFQALTDPPMLTPFLHVPDCNLPPAVCKERKRIDWICDVKKLYIPVKCLNYTLLTVTKGVTSKSCEWVHVLLVCCSTRLCDAGAVCDGLCPSLVVGYYSLTCYLSGHWGTFGFGQVAASKPK